jgi:hypothetical protein
VHALDLFYILDRGIGYLTHSKSGIEFSAQSEAYFRLSVKFKRNGHLSQRLAAAICFAAFPRRSLACTLSTWNSICLYGQE